MRVSDRVKTGPEKAPHRSLWKALGLTDEELSRPLIGVVSAQSDCVPGHNHLKNIAQAVKNFGSRGYARYAGVILNSRNVANEVEVVEEALKEIGGEIVQVVPRNGLVQQAENQGKTKRR